MDLALHPVRATRRVAVLLMLTGAAEMATAQAPVVRDSARCDSIVAAARADSVLAGLFIQATRNDPGAPVPEKLKSIELVVGAAFVPPRPFRLAVFSGAPRLRLLRRTTAESASAFRAPTVTGGYRFTVRRPTGSVSDVKTIRASLLPGFDSAAIAAIHAASAMEGVLLPAGWDDTMSVDIRFSTDSLPGSRRLLEAWFPRMPVVDAVPRSDNPAPVFPEEAKRDSIPSGDIVLRFVVHRDGTPVIETVELVRGTWLSFLRAALDALPSQRFTPATINGCRVAQVVEYVFSFLSPDPPPRH